MGVWTPRGNEDDEPGEVHLSGLEHLDGPGGGHGEITFELDEWPSSDRQVLADRLVTLGVPHSWEGTTLVVAEDVEKGGVMRRGLDSILHLATRWIP